MNSFPTYRKSTIPENAKKVFSGVIFDVYQWEQELFDGSTMTFERLLRADTAIVFPILEDGRILIIDDEQPTKIYHFSAPAGRVEEGETPEEAAVRELKEETGYAPQSLVPLYSYAPMNKADWQIHTFIGKHCTKVAKADPEPGERITLRPVTFDKLIEIATPKERPYHDGYFSKMVYEALRDEKKMSELRSLFSN